MAAGSSVKMRFARADELSRPGFLRSLSHFFGKACYRFGSLTERLGYVSRIPVLFRKRKEYTDSFCAEGFAVKGRKAERYIRIAQEDLSVKLGVCLKRRKIRGDTGRNFHRQISLTGRNIVQPAQEHVRIIRNKGPAGRSPCAGRQGRHAVGKVFRQSGFSQNAFLRLPQSMHFVGRRMSLKPMLRRGAKQKSRF